MGATVDSLVSLDIQRPRVYEKLPYLVFAALVAAVLAAILALNHGMLVYVLDDAYIHLSLAERIRSGTYGINAHETAAPASSILWPFLLAPFSSLPAAIYILVPGLLNLMAASLTLKLLVGEVRHALASLPGRERFGLAAGLFAVGLVLGVNLVPIIFTGMEHSLQQLLAVALVAGLIEEGRSGRVPRTAWLALVCLPLVRYDSLALAVPALVYLIWRGHFRGSVLATLAIGCVCGSFSAFLMSHGLGILPASVMAKSDIASSGGTPVVLLRNLYSNVVNDHQANVLLAGLVLLFAAVCDRAKAATDRALGLAIGSALGAEFLLGKLGAFYRYEAYIWAATVVALIHLYRGTLSRVFAPAAAPGAQVATIGGLAAASLGYLIALASTPAASNNIYDQQYQMHRFVSGYYHEPVAVNDLGWVAFRNPRYVLDFGGLASREALLARSTEPGAEWMSKLATLHDVHLVMIYDQWFPQHPSQWVRIGTLEFTQMRVTAADSKVSFYATEAESVAAIRAALLEFQKTLPRRASFHFDSPRT
jgi:hypothetical protein